MDLISINTKIKRQEYSESSSEKQKKSKNDKLSDTYKDI